MLQIEIYTRICAIHMIRINLVRPEVLIPPIRLWQLLHTFRFLCEQGQRPFQSVIRHYTH